MPIFGFSGAFPSTEQIARLTATGNSVGAEAAGRRAEDGFQTSLWAESTLTVAGTSVAMLGQPMIADSGRRSGYAPATADAVLHLYRERGERFLDAIRGRFAIALVDAESRKTILAVDPMGIESLAYSVGEHGLVFSSSARLVFKGNPAARSLDSQAVFDYLQLHMVPAPDSVYPGVRKVVAGSCVIVSAGRAEVRRYWNPTFLETTKESFETLRRDLHESLAIAVADSSLDEASGAFLSGGLDSSTVAGVLAKVSGRQPRTFSIGFGVAEYNEIEYARIAARRFDAIAHEYEVTPDDVVAALPRIAEAYDEPFGNSSAVPTYFCARFAASHGVTHLLAGDGGDEIFAGNERYSKQRVFEYYGRLPGFLRRGLIEPVADLIKADSGPVPVRKFRSYVEQARIPMPQRLEYWNYMNQANLDSMLDPDFRRELVPKSHLEKMAAVYHEPSRGDMTQRMLYLDWQYTLANNDLRKVGTVCAANGVRVSYPMLHPAVIDVSLRIPPSMMIPDGKLRDFYKRSMQGFLPDEIINKSKHGFGLPFGTWLKTHKPLSELIYALLSDLKARRIIRPEFLDNLVAEHRSGHDSFFGYAIWDLAMLEAWLSSNAVTR